MKSSFKFLCLTILFAVSLFATALAAPGTSTGVDPAFESFTESSGPVHLQPQTLAAAAPLCAEFDGVFKITRGGDGTYRLICEDGTRTKIRIVVVPGRGAGNGKAFLVTASR